MGLMEPKIFLGRVRPCLLGSPEAIFTTIIFTNFAFKSSLWSAWKIHYEIFMLVPITKCLIYHNCFSTYCSVLIFFIFNSIVDVEL